MAGNPHGDTAISLIEKYKAAINEEVYTSQAKEWFGTIVGFNLPGSRGALLYKLEQEAGNAYKQGRHFEAMDRFCHCLAVVDTDPSSPNASEMRATLTSNIGACLAQLGAVEDSISFYEKAVQEFKALPFSVLRDVSVSRLMVGKLTNKRVEYIEAKLAGLRAGQVPQGNTYQDGFGVTRTWSNEEMMGKAVLKWHDPTTWLDPKVYKQKAEEALVAGGMTTVTPHAEMI